MCVYMWMHTIYCDLLHLRPNQKLQNANRTSTSESTSHRSFIKLTGHVRSPLTEITVYHLYLVKSLMTPDTLDSP